MSQPNISIATRGADASCVAVGTRGISVDTEPNFLFHLPAYSRAAGEVPATQRTTGRPYRTELSPKMRDGNLMPITSPTTVARLFVMGGHDESQLVHTRRHTRLAPAGSQSRTSGVLERR